MAGFAGRRKTGGHVVWTRGGSEIGRVAGEALRGRDLEFAGRPTLVAEIAVHRSMRPGQRKAIVMLLYLPNGNLPSTHRVALLAICSQLPLVNVGVAILATLSNIGENRPDVTFSAVHRPVHAAQRIFRLVVIEFRSSADWLPCARGVAVLARNVQVAVRAVRTSGHLRMCTLRSCRKCEQQNSR